MRQSRRQLFYPSDWMLGTPLKNYGRKLGIVCVVMFGPVKAFDWSTFGRLALRCNGTLHVATLCDG